ncbi:MAG TPA: tetratricopeptide repeat protein [Terriglobales bacterium]|nr:tetratricopeptide repeat protein [Terriglobales bacterium]
MKLLTHGRKLRPADLGIVGFNTFYKAHSEAQEAKQALLQKNRVLIVGPPSGGKTRLAFNLAKDVGSSDLVLRLDPEFNDWKALNFPKLGVRCKVLWIIDDADKFLGKLDLNRGERMLGEQCLVRIIVTCRSGQELEMVRSDAEMASFIDQFLTVSCSDFTETELADLAQSVGKPAPKIHDRTPGSILLGLEQMRVRLKKAGEKSQTLMKAMFLLRTALIFSPEETLVGAVMKDIYECSLPEDKFESTLRDLIRDGFLHRNGTIAASHDSYLTLDFFDYYSRNSALLNSHVERLGDTVEGVGSARDLQSLGIFWKSGENYQQALVYLAKAARTLTDDAVLAFDMAYCFHHIKRLDEAIASYRKALQIGPDNVGALNNLGIALKDQGQLDEAVASYRKALQIGPDNAGVLNNLGNALWNKGLPDEAIASYRKALQISPDNVKALNNLGVALKDKGLPDEAIASYHKALEIEPDYVDALNNLGVALKDKGLLDEAIASYHKVLEIKPDDVDALNNLGNALAANGLLEEAIASFRKALEIEPDYINALSNLGNALVDKGLPNEAIASYRKALKIKPDYFNALNNLGAALADKGLLDEAIASYRKALEVKPDDVDALYNLGAALKKKSSQSE